VTAVADQTPSLVSPVAEPLPATAGPDSQDPSVTRWSPVLARVRQYGPPVIGFLLLVLAVLVLDRAFQQITYREFSERIAALDGWRIALSLALTALSFIVLAGYEQCALRFIGKRLPWPRTSLVAFVAQSIAHSTGFAAFVGVGLRYRIYAADGLDLADVARVQLFFSSTFVLGVMVLSGLALAFEPQVVAAAVAMPVGLWRLIGVLLLVGVAGYLVLSSADRFEGIRIGRHHLSLPRARTAALQILLATIDLAATAGALYVLLPGLDVGYVAFVGLFTAAIMVGVLSHVPGGLGVFESLMLLMLRPAPEHLPAVIGGLVVFRLLYYLLPLLIGTAALGGLESRQSLRRALGLGRRVVSPMAPRLFAMVSFLAGIVLLVSGALPAEPGRLAVLGELMPQPLIELSHFTGSLVGMALLLLARSLDRRVAEARSMTAALLAVGVVVSLLKGFDYEEAIVLAITLCALLASRKEFYRRASLFDGPLSAGWLIAIGATLLGTVWLIGFAYRHVEYAHEMWWQFELQANAPRSLRAVVGAALLLGTFGIMRLLRPAPARPRLPTRQELDEAQALVARGASSDDWLALTGDKPLLFNDAREAFIMYGVIGRTWVAMGQPVGPEAAWSELIWRFHEEANRHGARTVFYEVAAHALPHFMDLGLSMLKLGETARVDLAGFGLSGRRRASLRHSHGRAAKDGVIFELLSPEQILACMDRLEAISNDWLATHRTREKRFSLGFFDRAYLARVPVAVARHDGAIVAFITIWPAGDRSGCSPDLMRYGAGAPRSVMDFLMVEAMLWAKARGYRWFDLGMAPLAGLPGHRLAPLWSKLGRFLYRHGASLYNFEGLRAFKDKFDPVWEPVYLVYPRRSLPSVLADVASLIAGGRMGVIRK
jgi:phosphatidylglycerol lysyltransferase